MSGKNILLTICCCLLLASCTAYQNVVTVVSEPVIEDPDTDLACSYFYFLWGSHAEFTGRYPEALEAYEKALICDPGVEYLRDKLPILLLKMGEYEKAASTLQQTLVDHPEANNNRLLLASLYIQQEKISDAILLYNQILERDPENESVILRLGLLYNHLEEYQKAEDLFRQLLQKNDSFYYARLALARLLKQTGKPQEAIEQYEKSLELNWSSELAFELGLYYASLKKHADALRLYTTIGENDPFNERAALSRVQALLDMDKSGEALEELKNIRTFSRNPANIDLITSKVLLRREEVEKAKEILERLAQDADDSEPRYMLALLAYRDKDYILARTHLSRIPESSPDFDDAVYLQTRIYQESGENDKAIALLKKHIAKESGRRPFFYALLASLYHENKEDHAAVSLLEAAVSIYPDNAQLFFQYGLILDKKGMEEQAVDKMMKVLELQPDHAEALNFIGYTWADKNIRLKEALAYITKAAALKPDNGYIVDSLGWVYYRLGDFQRAVTELNRSIELEPNDPHIYDHLGDAYRSLGNTGKALEYYQKAVKMFEDETKKAAVQEKIDALNKH